MRISAGTKNEAAHRVPPPLSRDLTPYGFGFVVTAAVTLWRRPIVDRKRWSADCDWLVTTICPFALTTRTPAVALAVVPARMARVRAAVVPGATVTFAVTGVAIELFSRLVFATMPTLTLFVV